ncbi:MAG: phage tail protein [Alphaproteobacteria bacterium]|nr:phage tail protein [Alphaproteobacteria bacterium]
MTTIFGGYNAGLAPGAIMPVAAGSAIPDGFLLCDGSTISRELYPELFAVIGDRYGEGDGVTTFHLPNGTIRLLGEDVPVYGRYNEGMALRLNNGHIKTMANVTGFNNERVLRAIPGDTAATEGANIVPKGISTATTVYADLTGFQINLLIKYRW